MWFLLMCCLVLLLFLFHISFIGAMGGLALWMDNFIYSFALFVLSPFHHLSITLSKDFFFFFFEKISLDILC